MNPTPPDRPTHVDARGRARMVDVSGKDKTKRTAVAEGIIRMRRTTFDAIMEGRTSKGEVLQVARIAGIQAGKKTGDIIPLCHLLPGVSLSVDAEGDPTIPGVRVRAQASLVGQTGVEMEALTAVGVALLTVYDMAKALDRTMSLEGIRLLSKEGGRSGTWKRPEDDR